MADKLKTVFRCNNCGFESPKWYGKCPSCNEWNSFTEEVAVTVSSKKGLIRSSKSESAVLLSDVSSKDDPRFLTGIRELDRVLGGGMVKGSLILIGGDPGIGKSTILLQICGHVCNNLKVLYISGEESKHQIKMRADRLGISTPKLYLASNTDILEINDMIIAEKPDIVIVDSIQTMQLPQLSSSAGSVVQVRECTSLLMRTAKSEDITIFIVGHVNKDGAIAGPKVLEHIVDTVLYFEGDRHLSYRILRAVKNRFGSTNEIGVFEMTESGLTEVENPSMMLLSGRPNNVPGSCVTSVMEGSRPLLVEVQALVSKSSFPSPRRTSAGFDYNRMALLIAVIEKRGGYFLGGLDAFINIVGGFKLDEPGADLAVVLALTSSIKDQPIPPYVVAFGEVGLSGEIRTVSNIHQRISEAARLGFKRCVVPYNSVNKLGNMNNEIEIIGVKNIKEAFDKLG